MQRTDGWMGQWPSRGDHLQGSLPATRVRSWRFTPLFLTSPPLSPPLLGAGSVVGSSGKSGPRRAISAPLLLSRSAL